MAGKRLLRNTSPMSALEAYGPMLGEIAQHEINVDPNLVKTSDWYFDIFTQTLERHYGKNPELKGQRLLEIACYRHVLSYRLAKEKGFEPTLFDVSDYDLRAGKEIADELGLPTAFDRVAGEFHNLPFSDGYFDQVFVSAALHHTRKPEVVIGEAMRVLASGGLFYCQREPVERMFCFFKFPGNRSHTHTLFEKHVLARDFTRNLCSPYPGARNAIVFGRIENDHISLDHWLDAFAPWGDVVEEVLYYDGLLTRLDRKALENSHLSEPALAKYIAGLIRDEVEIAAPLLTKQDEMLHHSLPSEPEIIDMALRVAHALKARDINEQSPLWRRQMARIFGATSRFLVKRRDGQRTAMKYRRKLIEERHVKLDNAAYSGIRFWDRLLPDLAKATPTELTTFFPSSDWVVAVERPDAKVMGSRTATANITPNLDRDAVVAFRFRAILDNKLPAARLHVSYQGKTVYDERIPQIEDRVIKLKCKAGSEPIRLELLTPYNETIDLPGRMRINVIQAVPLG